MSRPEPSYPAGSGYHWEARPGLGWRAMTDLLPDAELLATMREATDHQRLTEQRAQAALVLAHGIRALNEQVNWPAHVQDLAAVLVDVAEQVLDGAGWGDPDGERSGSGHHTPIPPGWVREGHPIGANGWGDPTVIKAVARVGGRAA